jgi:hypothetical protein
MDVLCADADEVLTGPPTAQDNVGTLVHDKPEQIVEVDMRRSLDIFGQPTNSLQPVNSSPIAGNEDVQDTHSASFNSAVTPTEPTPAALDATTSQALGSTSSAEILGAVVESDCAGSRQAAAGETPCGTDEENEHPIWPTHEEQAACTDGDQFYPHDPEGLSTILEESSIAETQPSTQISPQSTTDRDRKSESSSDEMAGNCKTSPFEEKVVEVGQGVETCEATSSAVGQEFETSNDEAVDVSAGAEDRPRDSGDQDVLPPVDSTTQAATSLVTTTGTPKSGAATALGPLTTPDCSAHAVTEGAHCESSGFTPINGSSTSPQGIPDPPQAEKVEAANDSDELDADEVIDEEVLTDDDNDAAAALDEDTLAINPPRPNMDTLQLQGMQDDSETEMLRKFVTRVTADKNAKAAAAAAALASRVARSAARRSGSLGSTTSATGSPMSRPETESRASRKPLVEKSPNSSSPAKKRKHVLILDDLDKPAANSHELAHDTNSNDDEPLLKRRRKRNDPVLYKPTEESATPSPEPDTLPSSSSFSPRGPRRSTRARRLKPAAPSANAIALSMIPVRLPGMDAMDDTTAAAATTLEAAGLAARQQRTEGRDLAAITRANTRRNKGSAVPPQVVLARQAEDPSWRMRELKGVFEAREKRETGDGAKEKGKLEGQHQQTGEGKYKDVEGEDAAAAAARDGRKSRRGKGVRWAEELVRFQQADEQQPSVFRGLAQGLLADVVMGDMEIGGVDEIAEAEPPVAAEPVVEKTARVAARKAVAPCTSTATANATITATTRRTRSSRLQPPTPVAKISGAEKAAPVVEKVVPEKPAAAPGLRTRARSLPKLASVNAIASAAVAAPSSAAPQAASASARSGMATRRTRIAKLGMSGNGTPAPKRRGRAAAV